MASFFSDFGLMWYLEELNKKEFMKFKEVLRKEMAESGLQHIPWTEVKKASREDLANLLVKHYEKKAWDVTFRIFQNINRKDLSERAAGEMAGHSKIYQAHLKKVLSQDCSRKFNIPIQHFLKEEFTPDKCSRLQQLFVPKTTEKKPHTVLLKGVSGVGKTVLLAELMMAWSEGLMFQNEFSYVFYLCCHEIKQLKTASLADLLSREWPRPSAPIAEIVSQPAKLLFIIDSLEGLNCDWSEPESELCDNWMQKCPVSILLSSLLRRKLLPESSLLITATPEAFENLEDRIEYTDMKMMTGLDESSRRAFFQGLFQDKNTSQEVFRLVRANEQLFSICHVPSLCLVVATCVKNEIGKGGDLSAVCRCTTSVFAAYVLNLFIPKSAHYPSKKSQALLRGLCSVAAEGMWTDNFAFNQEDLEKNGVFHSDISTLLNMKILLKSRDSKNLYTFLHPSIQEFCAALFYLVNSHVDHPSKDVLCVETLLFTFLKKVRVQWIFLGCFIFGLLHKSEQAKLEAFFGYQLSQEVKQTLCQSLEKISADEELRKQIDDMKLFYCLFELEDDGFVTQVMTFLPQIKFVAKEYSDLIVAAYCLKNCSTLQKLSISTQDILQEEKDPSYLKKLLLCWQDLCSVLGSSQQIQVLQVKDTYLNELAFLELHNHLRNPSCAPRKFLVNNVSFLCNNQLFFELLTQNHNLHHLDLSLTSLSRSDVKLLCEVLNQKGCHIEELLLSGCQLSPDDCKIFASTLISSKTLRHLNVSCNNLDKGMYLLSKALCHPDCVLKDLVLASCSLSKQCWNYLSDVLKRNKTLSHLDISSNDLQDEGLKVLCQALSLPDSALKSLFLRRCLITSSGCQYLAEVLSSNQNLISLQVSNNKLEDAGVKLLCEAIKEPNCRLENLGLEACELTGACCEDLVSALSQNETLWAINLLKNALDRRGLAVLCEALKLRRCTPNVLGLQITDFDKETQELLIAEKEKNPYLTILSSV
ncbi:NACHT, LRR and PYD domains-containing protein 4C isoform X2 [Cricetulus griseus]|uniref:NACHT, LRR and PYD domains-containing protein 4C isoform X2 n=2 Tax=Cricetulus griseus TaxID=10029 RepID=A0A9J7GIH3_CRIGR|nr:NACHT, LRR and PYD domains-containing protein 4C isoform X2 [Cricetulus griseus]